MSTIWSVHVDARFQAVPANPRDRDFYAPYNKLLSFLFPPDSRYTVAPVIYPNRDTQSFDDRYSVEFQILFDSVLVFIVQIKSGGNRLYSNTARRDADQQMRERLFDWTDKCPLHKLYGVCTFGTRLCFYESVPVEGGVLITPKPITGKDPDVLLDTAPIAWWNCDVMEVDGADRLRAVVQEIRSGCD
jgi:hypothetical protein